MLMIMLMMMMTMTMMTMTMMIMTTMVRIMMIAEMLMVMLFSLKERRRLAAAVEELEARGATQVIAIFT